MWSDLMRCDVWDPPEKAENAHPWGSKRTLVSFCKNESGGYTEAKQNASISPCKTNQDGMPGFFTEKRPPNRVVHEDPKTLKS